MSRIMEVTLYSADEKSVVVDVDVFVNAFGKTLMEVQARQRSHESRCHIISTRKEVHESKRSVQGL